MGNLIWGTLCVKLWRKPNGNSHLQHMFQKMCKPSGESHVEHVCFKICSSQIGTTPGLQILSREFSSQMGIQSWSTCSSIHCSSHMRNHSVSRLAPWQTYHEHLAAVVREKHTWNNCEQTHQYASQNKAYVLPTRLPTRLPTPCFMILSCGLVVPLKLCILCVSPTSIAEYRSASQHSLV